MKDNVDDIIDLIGKSLAKEATQQEQEALNKWLEEAEANRKYYNQCKVLFEEASSLKEWQSFDVDAAWNKVRSKLNNKTQKQVTMFDRYWRVAASVLIVMGVGYFSYRWFANPRDEMMIASSEVAKQDTLPDGTLAFVNKGTTLNYQYNPIEKNKIVKLRGEAFFEIHKGDGKSFMIEVEDLIIKDIGTKFNVQAYPEDKVTQVYVEEGEVDMYTKENPGLHLVLGETGIYDKTAKTFVKLQKADENTIAYKTKSFVFHDARLSDLIETLNTIYDRKLSLGNSKLADCRITVSFNNESIDIIAEVIAETLKLTVSQTDQAIVLNGDACQK